MDYCPTIIDYRHWLENQNSHAHAVWMRWIDNAPGPERLCRKIAHHLQKSKRNKVISHGLLNQSLRLLLRLVPWPISRRIVEAIFLST
jgi:hypothetical protein